MGRSPRPVVGTDNDEAILSAADGFVSSEGLDDVVLMKDDIFASDLEASSFDLVHARYPLSLDRSSEQTAAYLRLVGAGGTVVLEVVDPGSWHCVPPGGRP